MARIKSRIITTRPAFPPAEILFCLLISILAATAAASDHDIPVEAKEIELESIRTQIRDVQSKIEQARTSIDSYMADLQMNETSIMNITINLESIKAAIGSQQVKLEQLQNESLIQEKILSEERELLAGQIRMAYKTGHNDFLKLLLNQENPEKVGRIMTYHDYYNRARSERISEIQLTLSNLQQLQLAIDTETGKLESLRDEQLDKLEQLASYRNERKTIIDQANRFINEQDRDLQKLQRDEEELAGLLDELKNKQDVVGLYENLPPFDELKGKLRWPVNGNIITRFGSTKKGGKLRWNGVRITAEQGNDVLAVSAGKVIFADWFRNLGLLIIIDHGDGYMSLYGHNERLLKKADDFVNTGEAIARAGNTGGQPDIALYFEIRQQGTPLNPALWCQR